jgi:hypothetical protein
MDATARGAFLSLNLVDATSLVEKMASNQSWNEERVQSHKRGGGMHQLKEVDMLSAKIDLLMKKLEDRVSEKREVMHINDSRMTCEECENTRHSGSNCPKLQEDVNYINNKTIILSKIKDGISNRGQTTKVTTKVTSKVIITIISINHP